MHCITVFFYYSKDKEMRWTNTEDQQLVNAVKVHGIGDWVKVAKMVPGRTNGQCLQRWSRSLKPGIKKGKWSYDEDCMLKEHVERCVESVDWVAISRHMPGRTSKQIRERWFQHLCPDVHKHPFTNAEDTTLLELHEKLGNAWTKIASHVKGRTADAVKVRIRTLSGKKSNAHKSLLNQRSPMFCQSKSRTFKSPNSAGPVLAALSSTPLVLPLIKPEPGKTSPTNQPLVLPKHCMPLKRALLVPMMLSEAAPAKRQKLNTIEDMLNDDTLASVLAQLEAEFPCASPATDGDAQPLPCSVPFATPPSQFLQELDLLLGDLENENDFGRKDIESVAMYELDYFIQEGDRDRADVCCI
jgi:hypothetical protein